MNGIDKSIPIPLYYQLKELLLSDIKSQIYKPGDPIPTELELVALYDVSRTTVRQAVSSLVSEGWLKRYKGVGTFVTEPKPADGRPLDVASIIQESGYSLTTKLVNLQQIPADSLVSEELRLPVGTPVYALERLRLGNRRHISYSKNYLPVSFFPDLERDLDQAVPNLNNYCDAHGYPIVTVSQRLSVVRADDESARILAIGSGTPILLMRTLFSTADGTPVDYSLSSLYSDDLTITIEGARTPSV